MFRSGGLQAGELAGHDTKVARPEATATSNA